MDISKEDARMLGDLLRPLVLAEYDRLIADPRHARNSTSVTYGIGVQLVLQELRCDRSAALKIRSAAAGAAAARGGAT